jgi:hypothetical protein
MRQLRKQLGFSVRRLSILFILAAVAVIPAGAQKHADRHGVKAPDAVQQAFEQNFAGVSEETWHKMASGNWYADFSRDSLNAKAEFTADGQWVATRTAVSSAQLPDTVNSAIQQKYPGATISQATWIQRADVAPYYQIALQQGGMEKDILANDKGTITE